MTEDEIREIEKVAERTIDENPELFDELAEL
jgi:hypothetical protein